MATSFILHFLLLSLPLLTLSLTPLKPHSFILPIEKDPKALQYSTSISMGTPPVPMDLVIDIRERFLWFECDSTYNSSTYHPIHCNTKICKFARSNDCIDCINHPFKTGCTNHTCGVQPFNPFGEFFVSGDLGQDTLSSIYSKTEGAKSLVNTSVPRFVSSCVYPDKFGVEGFLLGLSQGKKGVLGLAKTSISLTTQLSQKYKIPQKFALCLPSQKQSTEFGAIFFGGGPYYLPQFNNASNFLVYTPLIVNRHSTGPIYDNHPSSEYFIGVKSIKVDGKVVNFNNSLLSIDKQGNGGTKLSTVTPFTKLHSLIYNPFVSDFVKKASERKIKSVAAVEPFGACFDSKTIGNGVTGPDVPIIELELRKGVQWRMYGGNSMVKVNENVMCLGFVDGGLGLETPLATSIVIGGHQLEDNLLEFDLVSSKLGFTSSLLLHNSTCSSFRA